MNLWRKFRLFSLRLPVEVWLVISLLFALFSFGTGQIIEQRKAARTAAIQKLSVTMKASSAELDQIKSDFDALKKRGNITAEELRAIEKRLDEQRRKSEVMRAELEKVARR